MDAHLTPWLIPTWFSAHTVKVRLIHGEIRALVSAATGMCLCQLLACFFRLSQALSEFQMAAGFQDWHHQLYVHLENGQMKKKIRLNQVHFPHLRSNFSVVRLTVNNWMATSRLFQQDSWGSTMKWPATACSFARWVSLHCKPSTSSPWSASTFPYEPSRYSDEQPWKLFSPAALRKNLPILKQGFIIFKQLLLF